MPSKLTISLTKTDAKKEIISQVDNLIIDLGQFQINHQATKINQES